MSYTIETTHPETGDDVILELPLEPCDDYTVKFSADGKRCVVGYLCADDDPANPRKEFDNVGTMACSHRRYDLGDEKVDSYHNLLERLASEHTDRDVDELDEDALQKIVDRHYLHLPLYLYDHSGITIRTTAFSCPWDSGQVGVIYVTKKRAIEEWGKKICTKQVRDKALAYLKGEVEEYDHYLTGNVWGVCYATFNYDAETEEWIEDERDECWGNFGDKYATEELESGLKHWAEEINKPRPIVFAADEPALPGLEPYFA